MATEVIKVDPQSPSQGAVARGVEILRGGGLVAFPTETVYGVGACVTHSDAISRLRAVKARPPDRAFTVHIPSRAQAEQFVGAMSGVARRLARKGWPGPLTMILDAEGHDADAGTSLDAGARTAMYYDGTIGLRCPDDAIALGILRQTPDPVVAASANAAGGPAPQTGQEVLRDLDGRIDLLIDAGRTRYATPSTIVRVTGRSYRIVREGVYDARTINRLATLRLLFVCTGNTCRSPMAAALAAKHIADRLGIEPAEVPDYGIVISSAGTSGGLGGASEYAVKAMQKRGLDIKDHLSSELTVEHLQQADYIFAMTRVHRERILAMLPSVEDRVELLLGDRDVRDPAGGSESEYEECAGLIESGIDSALREVPL